MNSAAISQVSRKARVQQTRIEHTQRLSANVEEFPAVTLGDKALFDLKPTGPTSLRLMHYELSANSIYLANAAVWGITLDASFTSETDGWEAASIDGERYIWAELDRRDLSNIATLYCLATLPTLTDSKFDYTVFMPLWYVPWNSTAGVIDTGNIVSLRTAIVVPAMA